MSRNLLVLGRHGQVARELGKVGPPEGSVLAFAGHEDFDLMVRDDIDHLLHAHAHAPAAVINAAAYTAVDKAESEPDAAFRLNRDVPALLARACAARGIPLIHLSTDYVFAGDKPTPYVETDPRDPQSVYGRSKAEGEAAVEQAGGRFAILRTAWVYSAFGSNFVKTMLRLAETRDEIGVVADQQGNPTWAEDVARAALHVARRLIEGDERAAGVFHVAGQGAATWADFAEAIFAESARRGGPSAMVRRIATADYPTAAKRPANSRLDCTKIARELNFAIRPWRKSLSACFDELESAHP
ncbi:MAG: dTDP-4-dehydrorhamnose reductase [Caulobacteraceae bacterium]